MSDVRQRILDEAQPLFLAHGPSSVSVSRLCREMHIAKKTFYLHFPNKQALVETLVLERMAAYGQVLMSIPADTEPPDVRLRALLSGLLTVSAASFSSVYLRDLEADHPELWDRLSRGRHAMIGLLSAELERGQEAGVFRRDATSAELVALVTLMVDRILDPAVLVEAGLEPHRVAEVLFGLLFRGLLTQG